MSLTGTIIPYSGSQGKPTKRDTNVVRRAGVNSIPAEQPTMSLTGTIVPYSGNQKKRAGIPSEIATRSLNGEIELY
ncbi:hypothetical protein EW026_g1669 [Hermanssonia centrifuga]|uniref:Uncharacterized protein n=1 Tax=Hermanssonia centrifuga TaxID=98765 RepID=A0A4S4KSH6_9APHY|nr:hypothetical protein EW026_g1669 [Hermanssonia centrifuga]